VWVWWVGLGGGLQYPSTLRPVHAALAFEMHELSAGPSSPARSKAPPPHLLQAKGLSISAMATCTEEISMSTASRGGGRWSTLMATGARPGACAVLCE